MDWPKNNLLQNCSEGVWPPHVIREKDHCHGSCLHFIFLVLRFLKQRLDRFAQFPVLKCHLSILPIANRQHLCSKDHLVWDQDTSKTRCTETTTSPRPRQTMLRPSPSKTETELRPRLEKSVKRQGTTILMNCTASLHQDQPAWRPLCCVRYVRDQDMAKTRESWLVSRPRPATTLLLC